MSGGVDSSVAAVLLRDAGYDVVGCFMRLGSPGETLDELTPAERVDDLGDPSSCRTGSPAGGRSGGKLKIGHQGCCSINDAADARLVAAELGIPFYVCNFKKDFGRIIDYFVDAYANGQTPNPCVRCNDWLKFGKLHDYAQQIGAEFVASGHYARVVALPRGGQRLMRGLDLDKDQSYVLFGVPRDRLAHMLLPIGGLHKPAVRDLARKHGLPVFDKPDSQEICFVPDNDYAGLIDRKRPDLAAEGAIVDESGRRLGTHAGQHRFTVGQRRGLGVAASIPLYVLSKDPARNTVTVGPASALLCRGAVVGEANWLVDSSEQTEPALTTEADRDTDEAPAGRACWVKFRYNSDPVRARVRLLGDAEASEESPSGRRGRFEVRFDEPQVAVSPGQAAVVYDLDQQTVLGGGWIQRVDRAADAGA